ncbi:12S seed storage protein CRA1 [Forsythia ovata]|uniref:12S seed storage protein CRA1 n=1 Tax=Forsythia ovata TaxID=205694 RepID=A0ABD1PI33_9LAMI
MNEQQQHRLYAKTNCTILRLSAQEPVFKYEFEAGVSEFWNQFSPEFTCAGVEAVRNVINPKGLMLPHYNAAPQLIPFWRNLEQESAIYTAFWNNVVAGRGVHGVVIPGCAETYESEMESGSGGFMDRHQKVREFKEGDVIALPGGLTIWIYNHGEVPVVTVSLFDVSNEANQLDRTFRIFFLAGNYPILGKERPRQQVQKEGGFGNIFTSFDDELLADSFNVDKETASELKGKGDHRGRIVLAESFKIAIPREEEEKRGANGLEETLCTMKIRENLAEPSEADIFNPRGGLISTLNSQKLHILNSLQLSAERGVMYGVMFNPV